MPPQLTLCLHDQEKFLRKTFLQWRLHSFCTVANVLKLKEEWLSLDVFFCALQNASMIAGRPTHISWTYCLSEKKSFGCCFWERPQEEEACCQMSMFSPSCKMPRKRWMTRLVSSLDCCFSIGQFFELCILTLRYQCFLPMQNSSDIRQWMNQL